MNTNFLNFLDRCGSHALTTEKNPRGVDIKAFISAIKASRFKNDQGSLWASRMADTFEAQREALFGTLHGIYCDPTSGEEFRQNALQIFEPLKTQLSPEVPVGSGRPTPGVQGEGRRKTKQSIDTFFLIARSSLVTWRHRTACDFHDRQRKLGVHNAMKRSSATKSQHGKLSKGLAKSRSGWRNSPPS